MDHRQRIKTLILGRHQGLLIFHPSSNRSPTDTGLKIIAANGEDIKTYGLRTLDIKLADTLYKWSFIIADVKFPLLGADFLGHYNLIVDIAKKRILHTNSMGTSMLTFRPGTYPLASIVINSPFSHLQAEFPNVFKPELCQNPSVPPKHQVTHFIHTNGPPVHSRFRRLAPDKLACAKAVFHDMKKMGICQKAASPWASPLHMVEKEDGTWRPCGDYRRLNMKTEPDHYPLPNIRDITNTIHGALIFTKLDLLKGYYQVPVNKADIPKTAIITPFGSYTFNYSCFGLRNSGATFQRLMDNILGDLQFCVCYVDDILIYSSNLEQHE